ncbi:MAG: hypothetical protein LBF93_04545 [Zoogloeaceae bacterium]|jgi:hypothetical protein|nr:hypothetical protein [Zoogloeaceae bacterium]
MNSAISAKTVVFAAAAFFGFFCVAAAQPPAPPVDTNTETRVYSLGDFNRLCDVSGTYTLEGYIVALVYPQCKPGGACFPVYALISDAPRALIANEKAKTLIAGFYMNNIKETENTLNELRSGHAFRALDIKLGKKLWQLESKREKRLRLRVSATCEARYRRTNLVLEDFCSGPDCAGLPPAPPAETRVHSLGDFNRLRDIPGAYTLINACIVALAYPQCKPGDECFPVYALISDTPQRRIAHKKARALIAGFDRNNVRETENALNELRSGHAFRALDLGLSVTLVRSLVRLEPEKENCCRLRVRSDAPHTLTGFVLEYFCPAPNCAKRDEPVFSTPVQSMDRT